jgi:hypothetical protein
MRNLLQRPLHTQRRNSRPWIVGVAMTGLFAMAGAGIDGTLTPLSAAGPKAISKKSRGPEPTAESWNGWPALHLKVTSADGTPAEHADVSMVMIGPGSGLVMVGGGTKADGRFNKIFAQSPYAVLRAVRGHDASPMNGYWLRGQVPLPTITAVLQPGIRVHGGMTRGNPPLSVANHSVLLYQVDDGLFARLQAEGKAPKDLQPIFQDLPHFGQTDDRGNFEFFVTPGRYYLMGDSLHMVSFYTGDKQHGYMVTQILAQRVPGQPPPATFEIKEGDGAFEKNVTADPPPSVQIEGRAVLKGKPSERIAKATVDAGSLQLNAIAYFHVETDGEGTFRAKGPVADFLVRVQSADHKLSGIARITTADRKNAIVEIGPMASAFGRLVDDKGRPLAKAIISFGNPIDYGNGYRNWNFRGHARTNDKGEFELYGLTVGWKVEVNVAAPPKQATGEILHTVAELTPQKPGPVDLGDLKAPF